MFRPAKDSSNSPCSLLGESSLLVWLTAPCNNRAACWMCCCLEISSVGQIWSIAFLHHSDPQDTGRIPLGASLPPNRALSPLPRTRSVSWAFLHCTVFDIMSSPFPPESLAKLFSQISRASLFCSSILLQIPLKMSFSGLRTTWWGLSQEPHLGTNFQQYFCHQAKLLPRSSLGSGSGPKMGKRVSVQIAQAVFIST